MCWGLDDYGQASPPEGERLTAIDSGAGHSCGLRADGSVVCWGAENFADAYPEHERFVSIDAGGFGSCGIREDGVTVCWGDVYGTPETLEDRYSGISIGGFLRCGLIEDGSPTCEDYGLGGDGMSPPAEDSERFVSISAGFTHACALRADGTAMCWGIGESGQASPPPGEAFTAISSGGRHTCALREDGTAICWGNDESGQASPPQGEAFTAISSGGEHTCALRADGSAACWGSDHYGQSSPVTETGAKPEPDHPAGELLWRSGFPSDDDMSSNPTVADGAVYITLFDSSLHAIDASTGSALWSHQADGWITSSPVVVDGAVYSGSWGHSVYALDAVTGKVLWRYETADQVSPPLAVSGGVVYAGAGDHVYALDASTGEPVWSSAVEVNVSSFAPVPAGEAVYAGSVTGSLYALDASTGEALWQHKANDESYGVSGGGERVYEDVFSAPSVVDETVYIGTDSGHVRALDASTGDTVWEYETPAAVTLTPVVDGGVAYAASSFDGSLYALNASTGAPLWVHKEGVEVFSLAASGGTVYALAPAILTTHVYALEGSTGELRWRTTGDFSLGLFLSDDAVYASHLAQGEDGPVTGVSAFDMETGEVLWRYHTDVNLGLYAAVADGVVYVTPSDNYAHPERGSTGRYLYAVAGPRHPPIAR